MTVNYIVPGEDERKPTAQKQLARRLRARVAQVTGLASRIRPDDMQALDDHVQAELIALPTDLADNAYAAAIEAADALTGGQP
jgi:hypothetical protein